MKRAATIIQAVMGIAGLLQIVLGIFFWTGNALDFVGLHMLFGLLIVLLLWIQAALGNRAGVPYRLSAVAVIWGLIVPLVGMTQA